MLRLRPTRFLTLACAVLACAWSASPAAQDPPPPADQQTPVFRGGVDSVSVDVRVTDRASGKPVTDLTAADFEIRERGRVQTITTFKLIQIDDGREDPRARRDVRTLADQEIEAAREENRLLTIFLDDYHVREINAVRIRQQLADFVRELTPHDLVAIATPTSTLRALAFSRNHEQTADALLNFEGRKYDYRPRTAFEERYANQLPAIQERMRNDLTLSALEGLCTVLGGLRDGRKTILFVSEGLSGTMPPGVRTRGTPPLPGGNSPTTVDGDAQERRVFLDQAEVLSDMQQVFRAASRANASIYTIDPRGLLASEFSVEDTVDQATDRLVMTASLDSLRTIANETDGRAIVTQGDPMPELRRMVRDSSTYYLLGYTSTIAPRDGKFHEIDVRLRRRELQISARKGYWAYSEEDVRRATAPPRPSAPPEVVAALEELSTTTSRSAGDTGLTIWAGARRGSTEKPVVTIVWEAPPSLGRGPSSVVKSVNVDVTSEGGEALFKGPVALDSAAARPAGQVTFEAPPGMLRVRVTAESGSGERLDIRDRHLDVPDLSAGGPRLTTPFLFRGRTVLDLSRVRAQPTPLPSAARMFARSERILVRFQAIGAGATAPVVALKLLNATGQPLTTFPPPPAAADGVTHEAEMTFGAFPPGDYVIEISAEAGGKSVREYLAIRVTG